MPSLAGNAIPAIWRRIPWRTVWAIALWLADKGRERVRENLSAEEQSEFWSLIKQSKGRPGNLAEPDRVRMKAIVGKAIRGT